MHVFGHDDAPHGHMHIRFDNVRVPEANILLGEGRGFEISQVRLGPGRIHHCMRSIGQAEKALDLMVRRGLSREAFGKPIAQLGKNIEVISRARIEIEAMRLMVLQAAKAMDVLGNQEARVWVHMVKAMVPERVCRIIDQAIQIHGATGVSQWTPLGGACTPGNVACGWPTGRTRCITSSSGGPSSGSTAGRPDRRPACCSDRNAARRARRAVYPHPAVSGSMPVPRLAVLPQRRQRKRLQVEQTQAAPSGRRVPPPLIGQPHLLGPDLVEGGRIEYLAALDHQVEVHGVADVVQRGRCSAPRGPRACPGLWCRCPRRCR